MQSTWKSVGWPFLAGIAAMVVAAVVAICSVRAAEPNDGQPGNTCTTIFTAIKPDGTVHYDMAALRAVEVRGGRLCTGR